MFSDTPFPPEEPTGENPPDGAIIDYWLPGNPGDPGNVETVKLEILQDDTVIRVFSSDDAPVEIDTTLLPHPTYWMAPDQILKNDAGHNRWVWDLRHKPPSGTRKQFSIAAVRGRTPAGPHGPFAAPGEYTARLTVGETVSVKNFRVHMDPRVEASDGDIKLQTEYSMRAYRGYLRLQEMRDAIDARLVEDGQLNDTDRQALIDLRGEGRPGDPDILYGSIYASAPEEETIVGLQHKFLFLLNVFQAADVRPTTQAMDGLTGLEQSLSALSSTTQR